MIYIIILSCALIIFIIITGFFTGSETGFVSANKVKIERLVGEGNKKAKIVKYMLDNIEYVLVMTLVGTNLMVTIDAQVAKAITEQLFTELLSFSPAWVDRNRNLCDLISTTWLTVIILIFAQILPKTIYRMKADNIILRYAYPIKISSLILHPISWLMNKISSFTTKIIAGDIEKPSITRGELRIATSMSEEEGTIYREQKKMIHGVLDLADETVEHIMSPLVDMVSVEKNTPLDEFYEIVSENRFSRIPVYEERVDNIIGFVNLLDVLYSDQSAENITPFIREVNFVPETKNVNSLLVELQQNHNPIAIVVDEYGGVVGLVTIEDLVEEIVGEIYDERDETDFVRQIGPRVLECDAHIEVEELNHRYSTEIPTGDYETIAGYILTLTEDIPKTGDSIETDDYEFVILNANKRGIKKVRIRSKLQQSVDSLANPEPE